MSVNQNGALWAGMGFVVMLNFSLCVDNSGLANIKVTASQ
jgi:hypothetical protein